MWLARIPFFSYAALLIGGLYILGSNTGFLGEMVNATQEITEHHFIKSNQSQSCSPFLACPVFYREKTSAKFTKVFHDKPRNGCIIVAYNDANKRQRIGGATFKAMFYGSFLMLPLEVHDRKDGTYHILLEKSWNIDFTVLKGRIEIYLISAVVEHNSNTIAQVSPMKLTAVENFERFP
jgi:hypothetical protein